MTDLNNRNLFSHNSEPWVSKVKALAGWKARICSCLSPSFWWFVGHFGLFSLVEASLHTLPSSSHSISSVCSLHPNRPLFERHTSLTELGAHSILVWPHINFNYIYNDPILTLGHILRYWGLGLQHINIGEHSSICNSNHHRRIW